MASEVGGVSGRNEEPGDDNDDASNAKSDEEEGFMEYPLDVPTDPEGATVKTKSSEHNKGGCCSRYKEIETSPTKFIYANVLPEHHPGHGCRLLCLQ